MIVERCPWYVAGPILGVLVIGLRAILNRGFRAVGGYVDVIDHVLTPRRLAFNGYLLGGFVLGGALFAVVAEQWTPTWDSASLGAILVGTNPAAQAAVLLSAGVAIGFGARTFGCADCRSVRGFR